MKLPAGIYNVTVGQAVWKSVEVKAGEKTVLAPGFLKVVHSAIQGHQVVDPETGAVHGTVSNIKDQMALMPGDYEVYFGKLVWPVKIKAGETLVLKPGTVQVKGAASRVIPSGTKKERWSVRSAASRTGSPCRRGTIRWKFRGRR